MAQTDFGEQEASISYPELKRRLVVVARISAFLFLIGIIGIEAWRHALNSAILNLAKFQCPLGASKRMVLNSGGRLDFYPGTVGTKQWGIPISHPRQFFDLAPCDRIYVPLILNSKGRVAGYGQPYIQAASAADDCGKYATE